MKILASLVTLAVFLVSSATCAQVRGGSDIVEGSHVEFINRKLGIDTTCIGQTIFRNEKIWPAQSICGTINNETVHYGLIADPHPGYTGFTTYTVAVWSDSFYKGFNSVGFSGGGNLPYLLLQGDGNVVFQGGGTSTGCLARPGKRGSNISMSVEGPLPDLVKVRDDDGDIVRKIEKTVRISGSRCYPETPPRCVKALKERQRLTWDEYVCEYDSSGERIAYFGLDYSGLFGLWRNGALVWRAGPNWVRGDYLHLQGDGHLVLYRDTEPALTYTWVSNCVAGNMNPDSKITVSDGDVFHTNGDGSTNWVLVGEEPSSPTCFEGCRAV